jgi:TIR domain/Tetratricopeptide repeat
MQFTGGQRKSHLGMNGRHPPGNGKVPTYDVFISYRRKDTASVQPLVDALRLKGISVWFDQNEIDDFAPITNKIRDGLANSKAVLVWYSIDYPRSRPCQMELSAAFIAAQREGDPRKRVWVVNPENNATHVQPIELRDEQHGSAPIDRQQLQEFAHKLTQRVTSLSGLLGGIIPLTPPPQFGQRLVSARNFIGRLADLWNLHSALSGAETAIISGESSSGVAQLSGIGGVGKSLLAEEYALRFGAAYPGGVFWLRALGNDTSGPSLNSEQQSALLADQLRSFAVGLGIPVRDLSAEEIQARLATKLGNKNRSFLWIVDDLASGLEIDTVRSWLPPHPMGKAIITTRSREYQDFGHTVSLGGLAPEEAVELLCRNRKPTSPEDQIAAEGIAADLGYHPLALAVCSRALDADIGLRSFNEFRAGLADCREDELELAAELKGVLPNGHEKSVASTLLRSLRNLEAEGQDALRIAASLGAAPIPPSLVAATFAEANGIGESEARRRTRKARSQVESASLAEPTENNGLLVHNLVSRTMRFRDREKERRTQLRGALIRVLNKTLPDVADIRNHKRLELEVFHARELCAAGIDDIHTAELGSWVARHDFERGAYVAARTLQERAFEVSRQTLHPDTLISMNNLAEILRAQGDLASARRLEEQFLEVSRRAWGGEHLITLVAMSNLAATLLDQRDFVGARSLQEQVLEISRRVLEEENPEILRSMNNLAETLRAQGELAGARTLQEQVLEISCRVLGEEHPDTLISMNNLAETLRAQGELAGARALQEQVLEISCRVLGEEHPDTLISMNNLAATLRAQGDLAGTQRIQEQALEVRRRNLGEKHADTSLSEWNLLMTTLQARDFQNAMQLVQKLSWLVKRDPQTLSAMHRQIRKDLEDLQKKLFSH